MITIKLPIQNKINITRLLRDFNACMRFCYNRFRKDNLTELEIRHLLKERDLFTSLDSWFTQCAIREAKSWHAKSKDDDPIVFGGKRNLKLRSEGKITKEEWRALRLHMISVQGEALAYGNRKFGLKIIESNQITFKPSRTEHQIIQLPKLRKNIKKQLYQLQHLSEQKRLPYSIKLNNTHICITFDEALLTKEVPVYKPNRVFSTDANPNNLGWSILEFDKQDNFEIIDKGLIDNQELNKLLKGLKSNDPKVLKQTNKRHYEIFEIAKFLVEKAVHYQCQNFAIEGLKIKSSNKGKGKNYNRLVNNQWCRDRLLQNIEKRCNLAGITLKRVHPAYTSFIGNLNYRDHPDAIASSLEIGRRSYTKQFYPDLISVEALTKLWKQATRWSYQTWKELYSKVKNLELKYRVSFDPKGLKVFSLNSIKSGVKTYCFD